ncbi:hypothetical protein [Alkalihalobacillus sp. BA299]|nr:hypothetical protein [Alkalihalobacillus sp. BA299]
MIVADDIVIENVTFENSAGRGEVVGQALAAYMNGDQQVFKNFWLCIYEL